MNNKVKRKWWGIKQKTYLNNGIEARVTERYPLKFRNQQFTPTDYFF